MVMTGLTRGSACVVLLWTGDKKIIYGLEDSFFFYCQATTWNGENNFQKIFYVKTNTTFKTFVTLSYYSYWPLPPFPLPFHLLLSIEFKSFLLGVTKYLFFDLFFPMDNVFSNINGHNWNYARNITVN